MGRENIDSQTLRDKFLVNDFASKLQEMTHDGILTCAQIFKFAKK